MKYIHLPTEIDAEQWRGDYDALPRSWRSSGAFQLGEDRSLVVVTAKGPTEVEIGDFIARGGWGEFWPIREAVFLMNYKPAEQQP